MTSLLNALLFQLTWFGCVIGGAAGNLLWGMAGLALLIVFSAFRQSLRADLILVIGLALLGWLLDSFWSFTGILKFSSSLAPPWIVMLWMAVALTINHSLAWFRNRPGLGALLAGLAAPLCYLAGERLGAVQVPDAISLIWIVLAWAAIFFCLFQIKPARLINERTGQTG